MEHKELTDSVALLEVRRLQMVLAKAEGESQQLISTAKNLLTKTARSTRPAVRTSENLIESVRPERNGVVRDMGRNILDRASTEVSTRKFRYEHSQRR